ncbi:MAG TPA: RdgB/HAM1 family non-canonical purine NTP pyrophosphatase [Pyrinomonadaceae bacterium]|nr:RdgB/HAM1 family non-canonical purine NTP pyrophosphatase [Pyrinomonadaceae bacterium]
MQELLIATRNAGKVAEFARILSDLPLRLRGLAELGVEGEAEETGATFDENATLKAEFYAARAGVPTLADDSGLEVEALGGAPGVLSARYAGPNATDGQRVARLLRELEGVGDDERRARFVCVIALVFPRTGESELFRGVCRGHIVREPRGAGGFGYDPVFVPEGHTQTFGELPHEIKNRVSHRARAAAEAARFLRGRFPRDA